MRNFFGLHLAWRLLIIRLGIEYYKIDEPMLKNKILAIKILHVNMEYYVKIQMLIIFHINRNAS